MDLVAINGPWQAITFLNFYLFEKNALDENSIEIIFFDIDHELEDLCKKIFREFNFNKKTYNLSQLSELTHCNFNNVWISKLFSKNPKIIFQTFTKANIILFEEGLHSYAPTRWFSIPELLKTKQKIGLTILDLLLYLVDKKNLTLKPNYDHLVLKSHFSRCQKKYLLLDIIENDPKTIIWNKNLPEILNRLKHLFVQDLFLPLYQDDNKKKIMILGQYASYLNLLDAEYEINVYKKMIKFYANMDYIIYWKSHPRMAYFEQELVNEFTNEKIIFIRTKLPAEFYSYFYPKIDFIGISSSSLLYKVLIFNGTAYQVAQSLIDKINSQCIYAKDFKNMYQLISRVIPTNKEICFD